MIDPKGAKQRLWMSTRDKLEAFLVQPYQVSWVRAMDLIVRGWGLLDAERKAEATAAAKRSGSAFLSQHVWASTYALVDQIQTETVIDDRTRLYDVLVEGWHRLTAEEQAEAKKRSSKLGKEAA